MKNTPNGFTIIQVMHVNDFDFDLLMYVFTGQKNKYHVYCTVKADYKKSNEKKSNKPFDVNINTKLSKFDEFSGYYQLRQCHQ